MHAGSQRSEAQRAVSRARHTANQARIAAAARAHRATLVRETFAIPVRDCACRCVGRPVRVLRAGCLTPLGELGLDQLRDGGFDIQVLTVDEDIPLTAEVLAQAREHDARDRQAGEHQAGEHQAGDRQAGDRQAGDRQAGEHQAGHDAGEVRLGDLRTVAIPPRSFDIVHCALLLDRIPHVELVLDRFGAALRPGGLLLLQIRDRDCAAGLLDRVLPGWARRSLWGRLHPGQPGPFPAIYSPVASDRGIQEYLHRRDLLLIHRETARTLPDGPDRACRAARAARRLICWLSRGRATNAHDEVRYVIRKPEDRFARVV